MAACINTFIKNKMSNFCESKEDFDKTNIRLTNLTNNKYLVVPVN